MCPDRDVLKCSINIITKVFERLDGEMLVNIGAQACAGQLQDTVTGPPDAKLMEPNRAMLQAILEGTQITGTTVQWCP